MYRGTLIEFLNMGGGEIMFILAVVLLLFGGKKLPELARGLGKGIREFKDASDGVKREIHRNINSVGIVDDIKDVMNDSYDNSSLSLETPALANQVSSEVTNDKGVLSFDKNEPVAESDYAANTKIETDKTKL